MQQGALEGSSWPPGQLLPTTHHTPVPTNGRAGKQSREAWPGFRQLSPTTVLPPLPGPGQDPLVHWKMPLGSAPEL